MSVRAESTAQLLLMLGVGSVAACASWSHVVDLAARHGQPGWLAFADAAVLETLAVSMGLEMRRRRRNRESAPFAVTVLVAAVALQLSAQVAQAPRTFWGWTMAALPAVGFLLLAKVAMSRAPGTAEELDQATTPARSTGQRPRPDGLPPSAWATAPPKGRPAEPLSRTGGAGEPEGAGGRNVAQGDGVDEALLAAGRNVAETLIRDQVPLNRAALARGLREAGVAVGTGRAGLLLAALRSEQAAAAHEAASSTVAAGPGDRADRGRRERPVLVHSTRVERL
jgi:Protein of unknown function (DUF2637)